MQQLQGSGAASLSWGHMEWLVSLSFISSKVTGRTSGPHLWYAETVDLTSSFVASNINFISDRLSVRCLQHTIHPYPPNCKCEAESSNIGGYPKNIQPSERAPNSSQLF